MSKLRTIIKNPWVITLPVIMLLLLGWQRYTLADYSLSAPPSNILYNADLDTLDADGFPSGWLLSKGSSSVTSSVQDGYHSLHLLELDNSAWTPVNTTLATPTADVNPGKTYFYKGFYTSSMPFDLLLHTTYADGTSKLAIAGHYSPSSDWTTVSYAFRAETNAKSIDFVYGFSDKGTLRLDNNYLEQDPSDIYIAPGKTVTDNLIPNSDLASDDGITPNGWSTVTNGDNTPESSFVHADNNKYLHMSLSSSKNGEAKWRYEPLNTENGRQYQFDVTYRSDTPAEVVAEYELANGSRQYETIERLLPSRDWTIIQPQAAEAPIGSKSVFVTVVQHGNGYVDTKDYHLYDITKPGAAIWNKPYVSFTFDDGWSSTYTNGISLLDRNGYKATFYIDPSSVDTSGFMTTDQVANLKNTGHELASHGYEHLDFTTLPATGINYQMQRAYQYFTQVHKEDSVDFAAPFGSTDAQLSYYVRKYYRSLRGTDDGINTRQNFDPYNLKALYIGNKTPASKIANALNDAKRSNGWLILIYHKIDTGNPTNDTTISQAQFEQQLAAVKKSGVTVAPVSAVLDEVNK